MAFDIGSIEATLELDRSPFITSLQAAERAGAEFEGKNFTATLDANSAGVTTAAANATAAIDAVPDHKTTTLNAVNQTTSAAAAATAAVNSVPDHKSTTLDATNNTTAEALRAQASIRAVPNRHTTQFEARGDAVESVARRVLSTIRSIPRMVQIGFAIMNDPWLALNRIRTTVSSIGRRVIPIRFQTNAQQTDRDLNLVQRGILRVASAGARVRNAFGRDGSMFTAIGRALSSIVGAATRAGSALASLAGFMGRLAASAANVLLTMSGMSVTVQQLGQAASGALAGMGGLGAALGALAAQAAAAAPMLLATVAALAALAAAVVVLGGIVGAAVAAISLFVLNLFTLAGAVTVVVGGLALIGAAVAKVAIDLQKAGKQTGEYGRALQELKSSLQELKPAFDQAFKGAATEVAKIGTKVSQLAKQILPQLGRAAEQSVKAMEDGFRRAEGSTDGLKAALQQLPGIMNSVAATVKNLGAAFDGFLQAALPLIQDFVHWCESASKALAEWANSEQGIQQINSALEMAADVAKEVWDGLKQVGEALAELANNHAPSATSAVDIFFDAVSAGIGALDSMLGAIEAICSALGDLISLAGRAASALQSIGIGGGGGMVGGLMDRVIGAGNAIDQGRANTANTAGGIGRAYGGDVSMATGGTLGAHWVDSLTRGMFGGTSVEYGEALSGGNREYAFPMDGGTRFITEEPGYDDDSFGLWMDLGERKGWLNGLLSGRGDYQPSGMTQHGRSLQSVSQISQGNSTSGGTDGSARLESRLNHMENILAHAMREVRDATRELPHQIRESVNHNLAFGRGTRASVLRGLGRETRRFVFEGSF